MHPATPDCPRRTATRLPLRLLAAAGLLCAAAGVNAGAALQFPVSAPRDAVVDHLGVLYVSTGSSLRRFDTRSGSELTAIPIPQGLPLGLAFDPDGCRLAIADGAASSSRIWLLQDLGDRTAQAISLGAIADGQYGSYSVAWNGMERVLASRRFAGSGWANLRRVELSTGAVTSLASLRQDSMIQMSGDQSTLAVSESNISSGPVRTFDASGSIPLSGADTGWFQWEVAISPDARVIVAPSYNGAYVFDVVDGELVERPERIGEYAFWGPIGLTFATHTSAVFASLGGWSFPDRKVVAYLDHALQSPILIDTPPLSWTGNGAYLQGRTRLSSDGRWLSVTLETEVRVYDVADLAGKPGSIFRDGHECGDSRF